MKIIIATGGTGGHIFPALALLDDIDKKNYEYLIIADNRFKNFEKAFKKKLNFKIITSAGISGSIFRRIFSVFKILIGIIQAIFMLKKYRPNIVVSFGGYPAFPSMVAAKILGIPLLIHEPNSVIGQANKLFIKPPTIVSIAFKDTKGIDSAAKNVYVTGTPVRSEILANRKHPYHKVEKNSTIKILIIGGSQGARILSEIVPKAVISLKSPLKKRLHIVQQCRPENINQVSNVYKKHDINADISSFFVDIAQKFKEAHIIICRAGANTVSELIAIGRPAILVPISNSKENHQFHNAQIMQENKAGWIIEENNFTGKNLAEKLENILAAQEDLAVFAQHAKSLFFHSSNILVRLIEKYCTK